MVVTINGRHATAFYPWYIHIQYRDHFLGLSTYHDLDEMKQSVNCHHIRRVFDLSADVVAWIIFRHNFESTLRTDRRALSFKILACSFQ